ncbi:MAG: T9SS type A sorting domain-containing protein, partial [Ignavibacteriaceae bacterium]|nr:T9SS type A sorting domain-containing protein [Ignavibacteriaceae bacterium]
GQSWSYIGLPTNERMMSLYFMNENYGWACGAAGKIIRTTNYGLDWLPGNSGVNVELRDIKFINQDEGWSVGLGGKILHSGDGGSNWLQQNSGTSSNLFGVYFDDSLKGWVVGDNGIILKTTNGGGISTFQTQFEKTYGGINSERGVVIDKTNDGGYIIGGSTASFSSSEDMYVVKLDSTGLIQWAKVYNSFGYDRIHGVKQTADGGYYISGYVGDGNGLFDMAIAKIDAVGNMVWAKYSGSAQAEEFRKLSITPDGGFLVAGYNASIGMGAKDVQVMKISSSGIIEWAKTFGTMYEDFNSSCIVASDGNFVLSGALDISGSYGVRPTLIKLDTMGNIIWAKYYQGYIEDWGRDLIETPDGGFLLVGETKSYGLGGSQDIFLIKTDNTGNVVWAKAIGGIGNEMVHCAILSSDSKYVISGSTNSYGFGSNDAFLMKVDLSGDIEWFHTYGGNTNDNGYDVVEGIDQGFALTGRRSSNTLGGDDVWLVKTDAAGFSNCAFGTYNPNVFVISNLQAINLNLGTLDFIAAANLTLTTITPNSGQTTSCAIIPVELKSFNYELDGDDVLLKWSTASELNNLGFEIQRSFNESDFFTIGFITGNGTTNESKEYLYKDENLDHGNYLYKLIQTDYDGSKIKVGEIEVLINDVPKSLNLEQNYPNPFNPVTKILYSIPEVSLVKLSVYNSIGEKIADIVEGEKPAGYYEVIFDGSALPTGIYFYALSTGKSTMTKKMILLK